MYYVMSLVKILLAAFIVPVVAVYVLIFLLGFLGSH